MKQLYLILAGLLYFASGANAQSATQNYVRTRTMTNNTATTYMDEIQYLDGKGRPTQFVRQAVTPDKRDLVTLQEYDSYGRPSNTWLPGYGSGSGNYTTVSTLQSSAKTLNDGDARPYSTVSYELSPLNRPVQETGPGTAWSTKPVQTDYLSNNSTYFCYKYSVVGTSLKKNGNHADGELYVTKLSDEDSNISYEFKDKYGKKILTRQVNQNQNHDTYYVYDGLDNLRFVLPPLATDALTANTTWADTLTALKNYAYIYKYDSRSRCIEKKLPGCEPIKFVYDIVDRMTFSQDGEQRKTSTWTYYLYDGLSRVIEQGVCTGQSLTTKVVHQLSYYDNYDFLSSTGFGTNFPEKNVDATGRLTGSLVYTLESTRKGLYSVTFYDIKGNPVKIISSNHLGSCDSIRNTYRFTNTPETVKYVHNAPGKTTQTQLYTYAYDHAERLTKVTYKLNTNAAITLVGYTYDQLGRMQAKKYHGNTTEPVSYAYNMEHAYNVRGWLTGITGNRFTENLYYNTGNGTTRYNGNISSMTWKAGTETTQRSYQFTYDNLNRLTNTSYSDTGIPQGGYMEQAPLYDKHGNIKFMQRLGKRTGGGYHPVDNITLGYIGNQLKYANDETATNMVDQSFHYVDGSANGTSEYTYDDNGNMITDNNKNITKIQYNVLNLPQVVTLSSNRSITYAYSADGVKRSVVYKEGTVSKTNDYCGSVIYEGGDLSKILTTEGYITLSGTTPTYHYYLKDHLGNNRVVLKQDGTTVEQVTHYYPFGGFFEQTAEGLQKYKYNGKELDRTYGLDLYDYGARHYEPALGRFTTVDPHAESYYSWSPYHYAGNNPIRITDPTGMDWYMNDAGEYLWQEGSGEIEGYYNVGNKISVQTGEDSYINYYQNVGIKGNKAADAFDLISQNGRLRKELLGKNSILSNESQLALYNGLNNRDIDAFARPIGEAVVEYGAGAMAGRAISWGIGRFVSWAASKTTNAGLNIAIQFGKTENQIYHTFRHTDALGLDRSLVQSTIQRHLKAVSSQIVTGTPFNQVVEIGGHRIQYTAYKLANGTINIGRIHGIE